MNVVFLHIPKAGGTTFRNILAVNFPPEQCCPEWHNRLNRFSKEEIASFKLFSGHFDRASCDSIPDPKVFVTMMRDPKRRIISTYNFWRSHTMTYIKREGLEHCRIAKTSSLEDFLCSKHPAVRGAVDNTTVRQLGSALLVGENDPLSLAPDEALSRAKACLNATLAFGIVEQYEKSVSFVCGKLGFPQPIKIQPLNVTKSAHSESSNMESMEPTEITQEAAAEIDRLSILDQKLYNYAVQLFHKRYKKWKHFYFAHEEY